MTDNDRDLSRKIFRLFAAAASKANRTEAHKLEFCFRHRSNFMESLTLATVYAARGPLDDATRLTSDEVADLVDRLDRYSNFASSCQFAAIQGWFSVNRG